MGMSYAHTLIPTQVNYAPRPSQVAEFFAALVELGAAPSKAELAICSLIVPRRGWGPPVTGRLPMRMGRNPHTGETIGIPGRYYTVIDAVSGIAPGLNGLDAYEVRMSGEGPPGGPLFEFDVKLKPQDRYCFEVSCHLVLEAVSTSDYHRDWATTAEGEEVAPFGDACNASHRTGYFTNPKTGELIGVPAAGCARFWIKFAFGKGLFPEMKDGSVLISCGDMRHGGGEASCGG